MRRETIVHPRMMGELADLYDRRVGIYVETQRESSLGDDAPILTLTSLIGEAGQVVAWTPVSADEQGLMVTLTGGEEVVLDRIPARVSVLRSRRENPNSDHEHRTSSTHSIGMQGDYHQITEEMVARVGTEWWKINLVETDSTGTVTFLRVSATYRNLQVPIRVRAPLILDAGTQGPINEGGLG